MAASSFSVAAADLQARIRTQLAGSAQGNAIVWQDEDSEVLVHLDSLVLRLTGGWLVASVDLESAETGRAPVRAVFFLGRSGQGDGLQAAATDDPASHADLGARWGAALRHAVWNGVLDVLEGTCQAARAHAPNAALAGFTADEGTILVRMEGMP